MLQLSVQASAATLQRLWAGLEHCLRGAPAAHTHTRAVWWTLARGMLWWAAHSWSAPHLSQEVTRALGGCVKAVCAMWVYAGDEQPEPGDISGSEAGEWLAWRPISGAQTWEAILDGFSTSDSRDGWVEWLLLVGGIQGLEQDWSSAVSSLFAHRRRHGRVHSARLRALANRLLAPHSILSDASRVCLAPHFPQEAPGHLARGLLDHLPSTSSFATMAAPRATPDADASHRRACTPPPSAEVIDLTADETPPQQPAKSSRASPAAPDATPRPSPTAASAGVVHHPHQPQGSKFTSLSSKYELVDSDEEEPLSVPQRPGRVSPLAARAPAEAASTSMLQPHTAPRRPQAAGGFLVEPAFDRNALSFIGRHPAAVPVPAPATVRAGLPSTLTLSPHPQPSPIVGGGVRCYRPWRCEGVLRVARALLP